MDDLLAQLAAPPIFVVGHHRSGTTWVFDLLSYPHDVAGVFESWLFTSDLGLGGLLRWGHWEPDHVERMESIFGRRPGLGQLVSRDEVVAACRRLASEFLGRACGPETRYIVEKSPDHLYAVDAIVDVFPGARIVNVVRDGRDVAVSLRAAASWEPGSMPKTLHSPRVLARQWRASLDAARAAEQRLGSDYHEVSYEALQADPVGSTMDLYRFCGLDADEAVVTAAVKASDFETNYEGGENRFRRAGRTGDWRTRMTLRDRYEFHRGAGGELIARGFARSRWWWLRPSPDG